MTWPSILYSISSAVLLSHAPHSAARVRKAHPTSSPSFACVCKMAVGKNKRISKGKNGGKKKAQGEELNGTARSLDPTSSA